MEPRIQYAKTSDSVNIAYWTMGEGPPLLLMWGHPSNMQLQFQLPASRQLLELIAQRYKLIGYDARGCGLSDREVEDFSLGAMVTDIQAVVDHSRIGRAALTAEMEFVPVAVSFAAKYPDRVSRLVLANGQRVPTSGRHNSRPSFKPQNRIGSSRRKVSPGPLSRPSRILA